MPQLGGAADDKLPELGAASESNVPSPDNPPSPAIIAESGMEEPVTKKTKIKEVESEDDEEEEEFSPAGTLDKKKEKPAWLKFLLRPRVLAIIFGMAPVMITVIVGTVLVLIRNGTGIANGEGDMLMQGGQIALCVASLWAMYNLGMTFYFADRDMVTDMGHFVMIIGACWGMYSVISTFPSTFPDILKHVFYGYVAVATIALAAWLIAPYKGIGSPR